MSAIQSASPSSAISGSSMFLAAQSEYLDFSMPSYDNNQAVGKSSKLDAPSFNSPFGDFDFGASKSDSVDTSADDSKAAEEKAAAAAAKEQAAADEKAAKEAAKKQAEDEAAAKKAEKEARRKAEIEKQKAAVERAKAQKESESVRISSFLFLPHIDPPH